MIYRCCRKVLGGVSCVCFPCSISVSISFTSEDVFLGRTRFVWLGGGAAAAAAGEHRQAASPDPCLRLVATSSTYDETTVILPVCVHVPRLHSARTVSERRMVGAEHRPPTVMTGCCLLSQPIFSVAPAAPLSAWLEHPRGFSLSPLSQRPLLP